jgi:ABC-type glycerol-3-phosphate transport system substrate-binding protein
MGTLLSACGEEGTPEPQRPTPEPLGDAAEPTEAPEEAPTEAPSEPMEEVEIEVWGWDARATEDSGPMLQRYADDHPGVSINAINMGFADVQDKLLAAFTAGSGAPDITFAAVERFARFMRMDVFSPIPDTVKSFADWKRDHLEECHFPYIWDGRHWGWPFDSGACVWYYRHDILVEELGLQPPQTWQEFGEMAYDLAEDTDGDGQNDTFLATIRGTYNMYLQTQDIPVSNQEGDILSLEGENFDKTADTIDRITTWIKDEAIDFEDYASESSFEAFKNGRYYSIAWGNWFQSFGLKGFARNEEWEGVWRISPFLPWDADQDPQTGGAKAGGACWAVPLQTERKDLAHDICKFTWSNMETALWMAKNRAIITSFAPAYEEELDDIADPFFGGQSLFKQIRIAAERAGRKWFGGPNYALYGDVMGEAASRIILDDWGVVEALEAAKERFESERKY